MATHTKEEQQAREDEGLDGRRGKRLLACACAWCVGSERWVPGQPQWSSAALPRPGNNMPQVLVSDWE
jgi:hypothetical protein